MRFGLRQSCAPFAAALLLVVATLHCLQLPTTEAFSVRQQETDADVFYPDNGNYDVEELKMMPTYKKRLSSSFSGIPTFGEYIPMDEATIQYLLREQQRRLERSAPGFIG
ncbi:hypothetical protein BOX15_Mlig010686g2 [Macrostomum lignano]|uniref:Uncharacterized protein n=1 Tax=Macrostomum lignano TaxID=282301 RepID=A0A267H5F9_9PLAT|nr:hypothetical protein BOX15_Mlig010686g2 [Macrostomum lignano]